MELRQCLCVKIFNWNKVATLHTFDFAVLCSFVSYPAVKKWRECLPKKTCWHTLLWYRDLSVSGAHYYPDQKARDLYRGITETCWARAWTFSSVCPLQLVSEQQESRPLLSPSIDDFLCETKCDGLSRPVTSNTAGMVFIIISKSIKLYVEHSCKNTLQNTGEHTWNLHDNDTGSVSLPIAVFVVSYNLWPIKPFKLIHKVAVCNFGSINTGRSNWLTLAYDRYDRQMPHIITFHLITVNMSALSV